MNLIDLLLIVVVLYSIYNGWLTGFILGALELLMFAVSVILTFLAYPYIAGFLQAHALKLGVWTVPLSFIIGLIVIRIILSFIINRILAAIPNSAHANTANHALGILPGALNGVIWATIISALLLSIPFSESLSAKTRDSMFAQRMADKMEWLDEKFSPVFDEAVNKTINKLTVEPGSEKLVTLPFRDDHPKMREDLEAKMLVLVNEERQKVGLQPLTFDNEMLAVARAHSKDMFSRGYFSHITPEGLSPFNRMRKAKVRFFAAGENLALGQTLNICHRGLMNSPGHRANILNPAFGRVGIGILDGGIYGLMITQNFRN
ncbi:MAG: CvpA family protein [Bacteroidota bacterium]|nr:CvpA family protein [Bacteroidota bacterium]